MKTSFLLYSLPLMLVSASGAQTLPAPAPAPAPKTQPAPETETPLLENPRSFDEPLIIGEPVRKQNGLPRAKVAPPQLAPRPRASVAGVSIVGLSDGAAVAKLRAALAPALKEPVRLVIGGYQYTFLREELGASLPLWPLMRAARAQNGAIPLRFADRFQEARRRASRTRCAGARRLRENRAQCRRQRDAHQTCARKRANSRFGQFADERAQSV